MHADPRQVFAAVFGGPDFEPWVGILGATVDEALQAPLRAAQARVNENHTKLIALIKARAPADEIAACRLVQKTLHSVEDEALKAVADANAEMQRQNVSRCVEALEARIAPYVAAVLSGDEVGTDARNLAVEVFERSIRDEAIGCSTARWVGRCSRLSSTCTCGRRKTPRQARGRGSGSVGCEARYSVHNLSEGVSAMSSPLGW